MKYQQHNIQAAFELIRAGLWEKQVQLLPFEKIEFEEIYDFAQEHALVGLVAAGLEYGVDIKVPIELKLQIVGESLQLEQENKAKNVYIAKIIEKLRENDIYCVLVKGQGLAQCYSRPLWRCSCDIDLFFSNSGFSKAVNYITSLASEIIQDSKYTKSYGVLIDNWQLELHGTLRSGLSSRIDHVIDDVQRDVFYGGDARSWMNGKTQVFLPGVDSDLFLLFTHFVRHFYHHEFVLRQACDWCRFLWAYKDKIDRGKLETQLKEAGLLGEWKAFAALAVNYLGMPPEAMPLYDSNERWSKKAEIIMDFTIHGGTPNRVSDTLAMFKIFPMNTLRFLPSLLFNVSGMKIKERLFGI